MKKSKVYWVDVLKDPLSKFVLDRWKNYFGILALICLFQVLVSISSGTLTGIDINSLPREEVVLLNEEVRSLPTWEEPVFYLYYAIAGIMFLPMRRFFTYIPKAFQDLFEDGIIEKKKNRKKSTRKKALSDFNESLKEFEKKITGKIMFIPAFYLLYLGFLDYFLSKQISDPGIVSWRHFRFFQENWYAYIIVYLPMFLMLAIVIWKMLWVVYFMKQLNDDYDLTLKPYDTDGHGGFKPLEELWLKMSYVALPILVIPFVLSFLSSSFKTVSYSIGNYLDLFSCNIVIICLLIFMFLNYRSIVETQKERYLDNIGKGIGKDYKKIERALVRKKNMEKNSMKQIKLYKEIELEVKSIPSLPFTKYQKTYIILSALAPWITQIINYFQ